MACLLLVVLFPSVEVDSQAAEVVARLRECESLYERLSVVRTTKHEQFRKTRKDAIRKYEEVVESVSDGDLVRTNVRRISWNDDGREAVSEKEFLSRYDSSTLLSQSSASRPYVKVSDVAVPAEFVLRPHSFHLTKTLGGIPLSDFLSGSRPRAGEQRTPGLRSVAELHFRGREVLFGELCVHLTVVTRTAGGAEALRYELWLSELRNLLPVKTESFLPYGSGTLASVSSTTKSFFEVAPNVFVPSQVDVDIFNPMAIAEGRTELLASREVTYVEAKLEVSEGAFDDIELPAGAIVQEVDGDSLVGTDLVPYFEGSKPVSGRSEGGSRFWFVAAGAVFVVLGGVWLSFFRR